MRIKKFKKNKYILSKDRIWVRDLCSRADFIDINNLYSKEKKFWLENEFLNLKKSKLEIPDLSFSNIAICSDGLDWIEKQEIIGGIPNSDLRVIGTNGSLRDWKMVGENAKIKRVMSFYLVNNPYNECEFYLPKKHNYYPSLISSTRTNSKFIEGYKNKNEIYFYKPSEDLDYSSPPNILNVYLDDYRNPICAAISLAYKFNVKNLFLFCCDDAFRDERPGAVKMENGLYQYPQQIMSQNIIDKQLYWLKQAGIKIFDHSSGIKYENAEYINSQDLISFFSKE
jgi:hypothetical protein